MNETMQIIRVNTQKDYHNCEMIFSFFYKSKTSYFNVEKHQKYSIKKFLKLEMR